MMLLKFIGLIHKIKHREIKCYICTRFRVKMKRRTFLQTVTETTQKHVGHSNLELPRTFNGFSIFLPRASRVLRHRWGKRVKKMLLLNFIESCSATHKLLQQGTFNVHVKQNKFDDREQISQARKRGAFVETRYSLRGKPKRANCSSCLKVLCTQQFASESDWERRRRGFNAPTPAYFLFLIWLSRATRCFSPYRWW